VLWRKVNDKPVIEKEATYCPSAGSFSCSSV
jgi:hypothetical protein